MQKSVKTSSFSKRISLNTNSTDTGEKYFEEIAKNPFQPPEVDRFKQDQDQQRKLQLAFIDSTPLHQRVNNQAKARMLQLHDGIKQPKPRPNTMNNSMLSYSRMRDKLYAPIETGKFQDLAENDRRFLEELPRADGPKQPTSIFLQKQKGIFLVGLNLEDKKKERDRLAGEVQDKEHTIKKREKELEVDVQRFDHAVKKSDLSAIQNVMLQERALKNKIQQKQSVDELKAIQLRMQSEIDRFQAQLDTLHSIKGFLFSLASCSKELELKQSIYEERLMLAKMFMMKNKKIDGFCYDCAKLSQNPKTCAHKRVSVDKYKKDEEIYNFITDFDTQKSELELNQIAEVVVKMFYEEPETCPVETPDDVINALKYREAHNVSIQEALMDAEEAQEKQKKRFLVVKARIENELAIQRESLNKMKGISVTEKKVEDLTSTVTVKEQKEKQLYVIQQQISRIYNKLTKESAFGIGTLMMLSMLELKLEQLGETCADFAKKRSERAVDQKTFEKQCDIDRRKLAAETEKEEKEALFKEKMKRYIDKANEEIKTTDVRPVKNRVVEKKKLERKLAEERKQAVVDEDFFGAMEKKEDY